MNFPKSELPKSELPKSEHPEGMNSWCMGFEWYLWILVFKDLKNWPIWNTCLLWKKNYNYPYVKKITLNEQMQIIHKKKKNLI